MKIGLVDSGMGVIPFIKSIIKLNKKNDYYVFIDNQYFPYGNKEESELLERLNYIFAYYEHLRIEELLICCNTLSYIYLKYKIHSNFKVRTILEINLSKKKKLLTTTYLSNRINSLDGGPLATYIENNSIIEIIYFIKNIKEKEIILSCTHYPLIKELFYIYDIKVYSFEDELIESLSESEKFNFYIQKKDSKIIQSYFKKISINFIDE